jgi:hypothetical protein
VACQLLRKRSVRASDPVGAQLLALNADDWVQTQLLLAARVVAAGAASRETASEESSPPLLRYSKNEKQSGGKIKMSQKSFALHAVNFSMQMHCRDFHVRSHV